MKTPPEKLLIGAHTSIAGGVQNALLRGVEFGATTVQLFTSNQRQWQSRVFTEEEIKVWRDTLQATGLKQIMSHDSYLINLGSTNEEILQKSLEAFLKELIRCQQLGISFLNFHPGSATGNSEEVCLEQIVKSLKQFIPQCEKGATRLLLETTAGQGSSVGHRFEHLDYIIQQLKNDLPIGVCIDTCHIFSAGYDIRTEEAWEKTFNEFDRIIGIEHLYAFHINDSLKPFGARRDRHAYLGKGEIGWDCFKYIMNHPRLREIPKYLETPDDPPLWKTEIATLRNLSL